MVIHFIVVGLILPTAGVGILLAKSRFNTKDKSAAPSRGPVEALGLAVVGVLVAAILGSTIGATWVFGWSALYTWFACWTLSGAWAPGTQQTPWLRPFGLVVGGLCYGLFVGSPMLWPILKAAWIASGQEAD